MSLFVHESLFSMSSDDPFNSVERSLQFVGAFEAELLLELMLRHWGHPCANDRAFRNDLLETVSEILIASSSGEVFIEGLLAQDMNLVSAAWFIEKTAINDADGELRAEWADRLRRAIPSCFVNEDEFHDDDVV